MEPLNVILGHPTLSFSTHIIYLAIVVACVSALPESWSRAAGMFRHGNVATPPGTLSAKKLVLLILRLRVYHRCADKIMTLRFKQCYLISLVFEEANS